MFDALKTLIIYNIQSHTQTVLHFNRTGLHRINAEGSGNSYGKSAIFKAMYALFLGESLDKEGREALIRDNCEFGVIMATSYNGVRLSLLLHLEASRCYYELEYNGQKVRKQLSDDYKALLRMANFHYLPDSKFSLNRYKTKTTLPFTHTSGTLNYKVLDSASEIPQIKDAIEIFDEKLSTIKEDKETIRRKIVSLTEQFKLMDDSGIDIVRDKLLYLKTTYENYKKLKPLVNSLDNIVNANNEISKLDLNDYKYAGYLLPQLKLVEKMKDMLEHVVKSEQEMINLKENGMQKPLDITPLLRELTKLGYLSDRIENDKNLRIELNSIKVEKVDNLQPIINDLKLISGLKQTTDTIVNVNTEITNLKVEKVENVQPIINELKAMNELINSVENIKSVTLESNNLKLNRVENIQPILNQLSNLQILTKETENIKQIESSLVDIKGKVVVDIKKASYFLRCINIINDSRNSILKSIITEKKLIDLKQSLTELDTELINLNKEIGICSKCGNKLSEFRHRKEVS